MYALVRSLPYSVLLTRQLPVVVAGWLTAETFYKFHSFTLESAAFLVTWYVYDWIAEHVERLLKTGR